MKSHASNQRCGAILVIVLVCLAVSTAIILGAVQTSLRFRRQIRRETQAEQARWIVDGGMRYAISQLRANPDYRGESIRLTPEIKKPYEATVTIVITKPDATLEATPDVKPQPNDDRITIHVTAQLGASERPDTVRRSGVLKINRATLHEKEPLK